MCYGPFYNPEDGLVIQTGGSLPHWNQTRKIQFITIRLADSLPQDRIAEIRSIKDEFLRQHPEQPWSNETIRHYHTLVGIAEEKLMDNGYGSCILRLPQVRNVLEETIRYFDGLRFKLIAYVIMPNHVHLLVQTIENYALADILHSIKRHSARNINKLIERTGGLWFREYYDRMIRNRGHFDRALKYIENNPRFLPQSQYSLYINSDFISKELGI